MIEQAFVDYLDYEKFGLKIFRLVGWVKKMKKM